MNVKNTRPIYSTTDQNFKRRRPFQARSHFNTKLASQLKHRVPDSTHTDWIRNLGRHSTHRSLAFSPFDGDFADLRVRQVAEVCNQFENRSCLFDVVRCGSSGVRSWQG